MGRSRDIATFLSKTEQDNTSNLVLLNSSSSVGLDSAQVTTIATDAGIAVYTALDSLPSTGLSSGDQAWVESSGRLYISNGSGWYNIALVNASPTLTLDQSGTIQLNADTLDIVVTASAADSDDNQAIISFSVESDGNMVGTGTTLSQDSSVFTITALSEDSGGTAGEFTLTFKATDQIAVDNEALSFRLAFSNQVDSSSATLMLMKATGNNAGNTSIKYIDSADSESTWTTTGTVSAGTLSPYRSGGYSAYFGAGNVGFYAADNAEFTLGTSDFCMEGWLWITDYSPLQMFFSQWAQSGVTNSFQCRVTTGGYLEFVLSDSTTLTATGTQVPTRQWVHYAFVRNGSNFNIYQDGVSLYSDTSFSHTFTDTSDPLYVGRWYGSTDYAVEGYMFDVRFVVGSPVYTGAFTPPTAKLKNITNTKLLTCRLPYIGDESTTSHDLTINGAVETRPFGPYDYEPYSGDDHGGSIYFNGEGNYLSHTVPSDVQTLGRQDQSMTLEGWIRPTGTPTNFAFIYGVGNHGTTGGNNLYGLEIGTTYQLRGAVNGAYTTASGMPQTSNNVIKANVWNHVALVQDAGAWTIYVNGKSEATQGSTSYMSGTTHTTGWVGRSHYDDNRYWPGYVSNLRIHDTAIYTSAFTPPTSPVTSPKLLLNKDGTNSNIFDEAAANTLVLNSAAQSSTTQRKFTTSSSISIAGTDDKVTVYNLGLSGDMTFEGWFNQTTAQSASYRTLLEASTYNATTPFGLFTYNAQVQLWGLQNSVQITGSFTANTWHHIAIVRNSGTWTLYIDGTSQGTNTNNGTYVFADTTDWSFGAQGSNASDFIGYMQDWRISDTARYTANFTAPTAEFEL